IREVLPAGWLQTSTNPPDIVATNTNDVHSGNDFGNFKLVSIGGTVYNDNNANGARDAGEPALGGWTVYLDTNNNGALDTGDTSTTTAADGSYTFTSLGPNPLRVREVPQAGWNQTLMPAVTVMGTSGQVLSGQDFGSFKQLAVRGQV